MIGMMMIAAAVQAAPASAGSIAAAMADSAAGWNAGDLDRFMALYADGAVYVTAKGVVEGKRAIAARYAPSFAKGGNRRGRLSFQPLVERPIDPEHRLYIARWRLDSAKVQTGLTTLLFERRGGRWLIVSDHSS